VTARAAAVLAATDLAKAFGGVQAVDGVSFAVAAGEMLALIGPNGAGKTTCFNLLNGQLPPDRGRVVFDGRDITGRRPRDIWRLGVGRTFQIAAAFGSMTVRENVQMALLSHRRETRRLWRPATRFHADAADVLLARVGMEDQAERAAGLLAYGDVKRVELAVALAHGPKLLLMDEPTAGMAPGERADLMRLVAGIVRAETIAVLFTEHDMDVVFGHADRIMVMNRGRLVAEGTPAAVRANAAVREIYLGGSVARTGPEAAA
jgi:branched-chain amino acid transport system ATP-binding protein